MAGLRFSLTNLLEGETVLNGTGGGAPARNETSPWLMENALNRDRGMPWQGVSGGSIDFDVDVDGSPTMAVWAVLGHRGAPSSSAGITSVDVKRQTGAYAPGGAFITAGTITLGSGVRDGVLVASGAADTIRWSITPASAFTVGRLWAGLIDVDFGILSSPGYARRWVDPQMESRMADLSPFITYSGDGHWEYTLPYESVGATLYGKLKQMGQRRRTFLLLDGWENTAYEARVMQPFQHTLKFFTTGGIDEHDSALMIETLG